METLIVIDIMGHRSSKGELKGFNNSTAPTNSAQQLLKQFKQDPSYKMKMTQMSYGTKF